MLESLKKKSPWNCERHGKVNIKTHPRIASRRIDPFFAHTRVYRRKSQTRSIFLSFSKTSKLYDNTRTRVFFSCRRCYFFVRGVNRLNIILFFTHMQHKLLSSFSILNQPRCCSRYILMSQCLLQPHNRLIKNALISIIVKIK